MRIITSEAHVPAAAAPKPAPRASPVAETPKEGEPSPFGRVLHRLGQEVDTGERVVATAMKGGNVHDPASLLALQAGIYKYVEAVDLASKLVDRATSAVKTVLQGQ